MRKILSGLAAVSLVTVLVIGLTYQPRAAATVPGVNTRASLSGSGAQSTADDGLSVISRDGRYVAFTNLQNNFVGTDTNNAADVFVRDLANNTTTRASVSTLGVSADNGTSLSGLAISETGRYVVFSSNSTNLIDGRTISATNTQMYMRDMVNNTTTILSEASPGTIANGGVSPISVSTDGRFVLFNSAATNLGSSGARGLFLLDRSSGTFIWVNAQAPGAPNYTNPMYGAQMSCDGSFVVFDWYAATLGLTPTGHTDVFLFDTRNGNTLTNITGSANGAALQPTISCNGNYIGFASYANNLDPMTAGMSLGYHGYRYDRIAEQFRLVDQNAAGTIANANIKYTSTDPLYMSLSDTGKVAFASYATNLDSAASSGYHQMFIRDPEAGTTELLSKNSGGTEADNDTTDVSLSLDGALANYSTYATNLVTGDTNSLRDSFVSQTGF